MPTPCVTWRKDVRAWTGMLIAWSKPKDRLFILHTNFSQVIRHPGNNMSWIVLFRLPTHATTAYRTPSERERSIGHINSNISDYFNVFHDILHWLLESIHGVIGMITKMQIAFYQRNNLRVTHVHFMAGGSRTRKLVFPVICRGPQIYTP